MALNHRYIVLFVTFTLSLVILAFNSIYVLHQTQCALVLQLGKPVKVIKEPGLRVKLPFIQNVIFFDRRIQNITFSSNDANEFVTAEQKTMKADAYCKYRIVEPLRFYESVNNEYVFRERLLAVIESSLRKIIGSVSFNDVLRENRKIVIEKVLLNVKTQMRAFGIEVIDVRLVSVQLPEKALKAVYERMKTDREKEAVEIRSQGAAQAKLVRTTAEKDCELIIAEAERRAQEIMGEGDAEAAKIVAAAAASDKDFYVFYKRIEGYKKALSNKTYFLLSDEMGFLDTFFKGVKNE
ncbi:Modulator of FtsH protease HflC [Candidatus Fokinia cryptica]|uniref:Protein HflC n=2 Tax=Candidatus Fokinia crypta TaxID=1920990 RepID=A0ABZ0UN97_9RICK|nr:Modulator of FtsH protease HflC [Candidatus Fokinia cryptica]